MSHTATIDELAQIEREYSATLESYKVEGLGLEDGGIVAVIILAILAVIGFIIGLIFSSDSGGGSYTAVYKPYTNYTHTKITREEKLFETLGHRELKMSEETKKRIVSRIEAKMIHWKNMATANVSHYRSFYDKYNLLADIMKRVSKDINAITASDILDNTNQLQYSMATNSILESGGVSIERTIKLSGDAYLSLKALPTMLDGIKTAITSARDSGQRLANLKVQEDQLKTAVEQVKKAVSDATGKQPIELREKLYSLRKTRVSTATLNYDVVLYKLPQPLRPEQFPSHIFDLKSKENEVENIKHRIETAARDPAFKQYNENLGSTGEETRYVNNCLKLLREVSAQVAYVLDCHRICQEQAAEYNKHLVNSMVSNGTRAIEIARIVKAELRFENDSYNLQMIDDHYIKPVEDSLKELKKSTKTDA